MKITIAENKPTPAPEEHAAVKELDEGHDYANQAAEKEEPHGGC